MDSLDSFERSIISLRAILDHEMKAISECNGILIKGNFASKCLKVFKKSAKESLDCTLQPFRKAIFFMLSDNIYSEFTPTTVQLAEPIPLLRSYSDSDLNADVYLGPSTLDAVNFMYFLFRTDVFVNHLLEPFGYLKLKYASPSVKAELSQEGNHIVLSLSSEGETSKKVQSDDLRGALIEAVRLQSTSGVKVGRLTSDKATCLLLEFTQTVGGMQKPIYTEVEYGPKHTPIFVSTVAIDGYGTVSGAQARTKKEAQVSAAEAMIRKIKAETEKKLQEVSRQKF